MVDMASGCERNALPFNPHVHHHRCGHGEPPRIPKGCIGIRVGNGKEEKEEEQQRFVIPVAYVTHPLFMQLLKKAEEEYGFRREGPITIPCGVDYFHRVRCSIDEDEKKKLRRGRRQQGHQQQHHRHHVWCFG